MSAIGKASISSPGRVRVEGVNVEGDDQADRRVHGGPDKAVYAYASEDAAFWEAELGRELGRARSARTSRPRASTSAARSSASAGGSATSSSRSASRGCRATSSRLRMGDPTMVKRFAQASRPGAYLRIVVEGSLGAGDAIEVLSRPAHGPRRQRRDPARRDAARDGACRAPELPASRWMRAALTERAA